MPKLVLFSPQCNDSKTGIKVWNRLNTFLVIPTGRNMEISDYAVYKNALPKYAGVGALAVSPNVLLIVELSIISAKGANMGYP